MKRLMCVALAGVLLAGLGLARAADEPAPAGTWKIKLPMTNNFGDAPLWLVRLENKDGKWSGRVLGNAKAVPEATVEGVSVTKDRLRFVFNTSAGLFPFDFRLPAGEGGRLYGVLRRGGNLNPAEMEATTVGSLDDAELLRETLATKKEPVAVLRAGFVLLSMASKIKAKPEEVRSWAARAARAAEAYGPAWHRDALLSIVDILGEQKGYEAVALTYARQAERLLEDRDRPDLRKRVLDALAGALERAGKADEAKEVAARAAKIDLTIKPEPFAGRQGKSDRAVLVELFTGAECPPCVAAELAFDALGKTFKPAEVVRLQYHLHIPGPDPLTSPDAEDRAQYYRVEGTPAALLDGRPAPGEGGGSAAEGWGRYDEYRESIVPLLEHPAGAKLLVTVRRQGESIPITVKATEVRGDGNNLRLRVVLAEEQVSYKGRNKVAEHQHVVRAFVGGVKGEKLTKGENFEKTFTADLGAVRKQLREYLDKTEKDTPFPRKDRPLALKNLRVVAFVQNDSTREVLQAAQVEVPAE